MRSLLAVPAIRTEFFEKAVASQADALFLDLEDSIFVDQKLKARANAINALNAMNWQDKRVLVRVNGLDSEWGFRDIVDVAAACPRLDGILAPKIGAAHELQYLEQVIRSLNRERPADRPLELHILIETALGVARVEQILEAATCVASVSFGVGDYSLSLGAHDRLFGSANADYAVLADGDAGRRTTHLNDQWHFAMARVVNACYAFGITPIDGPFANFSDDEGYLAAARRGNVLGYEGKWAIHPRQIALANRAFMPSDKDVAWARRVVGAMQEAHDAGRGSAQLDGALIEAAMIDIVNKILAKVDGASNGALQ